MPCSVTSRNCPQGAGRSGPRARAAELLCPALPCPYLSPQHRALATSLQHSCRGVLCERRVEPPLGLSARAALLPCRLALCLPPLLRAGHERTAMRRRAAVPSGGPRGALVVVRVWTPPALPSPVSSQPLTCVPAALPPPPPPPPSPALRQGTPTRRVPPPAPPTHYPTGGGHGKPKPEGRPRLRSGA